MGLFLFSFMENGIAFLKILHNIFSMLFKAIVEACMATCGLCGGGYGMGGGTGFGGGFGGFGTGIGGFGTGMGGIFGRKK